MPSRAPAPPPRELLPRPASSAPRPTRVPPFPPPTQLPGEILPHRHWTSPRPPPRCQRSNEGCGPRGNKGRRPGGTKGGGLVATRDGRHRGRDGAHEANKGGRGRPRLPSQHCCLQDLPTLVITLTPVDWSTYLHFHALLYISLLFTSECRTRETRKIFGRRTFYK